MGYEQPRKPAAAGGANYRSGADQRTGGSTGDQVIAHGLGAIPKALKITALQRNGNVGFAKSEGVRDQNGMNDIFISTFTAGDFDSGRGTRMIHLVTASGQIFYADAAFDATNITITWQKAGAPSSNTVYLTWEVIG